MQRNVFVCLFNQRVEGKYLLGNARLTININSRSCMQDISGITDFAHRNWIICRKELLLLFLLLLTVLDVQLRTFSYDLKFNKVLIVCLRNVFVYDLS